MDKDNKFPILADVVTTSASGLDPHISVASAPHQVSCVASARGWSEAEVTSLIEKHTEDVYLEYLVSYEPMS